MTLGTDVVNLVTKLGEAHDLKLINQFLDNPIDPQLLLLLKYLINPLVLLLDLKLNVKK